MKHRNASAATEEHVTLAEPAPPNWKPLATQLRLLDQRVGMSADVPDAATLPHLRALIRLDDMATGESMTLPPRLRHRLRPGPPNSARLELLAPETERGRQFVHGLRLTWSGRRAAELAPLWEALNVEVRGRGTLEAAAGVLAAWARAFPDAVVSVTETAGGDREQGDALEKKLPME